MRGVDQGPFHNKTVLRIPSGSMGWLSFDLTWYQNYISLWCAIVEKGAVLQSGESFVNQLYTLKLFSLFISETKREFNIWISIWIWNLNSVELLLISELYSVLHITVHNCVLFD